MNRSEVGKKGPETRLMKKRKQKEVFMKTLAARPATRKALANLEASASHLAPIPQIDNEKKVRRVIGEEEQARIVKRKHEERITNARVMRLQIKRQLCNEVASLKRQLKLKETRVSQLLRNNDILRKQLPQKRTSIEQLSFASQKHQLLQLNYDEPLVIADEEQQNLSVETANAFRYAFKITDQQYKAICKFNGRVFPPLESVQQWSSTMVKEAMLVDYVRADGIRVLLWGQPEYIFDCYLRRLLSTRWNNVMPKVIHVVVCGERGGNSYSNWTKFGLFVPDEDTDAQSSTNFLVLAVHDGPETVELIKDVGGPMFEFINGLAATRKYETSEINVEVEVLAVADPKFLSMMVGASHHTANNFCSTCTMNQKQHREEPAIYRRRIPFKCLLNVEPNSIVVPPLHTLQECANTVLKAMWLTDANNLQQLFTAAHVKQTHHTASLLNCHDCMHFLKYIVVRFDIDIVYRHTQTQTLISVRPVLQHLSNIVKWVETMQFSSIDLNALRKDIGGLSMEWRRAVLPSIDQLHIIEAHLPDFLCAHMSWGLYGDQGLESMRNVADVLAEKHVGINDNDRLPFFMRRQLLTAFTDAEEFDVTERRSRSESPRPYADPSLLYDEDIDVGEEVENKWFNDAF